jgi:hypothetical protein
MQGVLKIVRAKGVALHDLTAGPPSVLKVSGMAGEAADRVTLLKESWNKAAADITGGTRHKHPLDRGSHGILLRLLQFDW